HCHVRIESRRGRLRKISDPKPQQLITRVPEELGRMCVDRDVAALLVENKDGQRKDVDRLAEQGNLDQALCLRCGPHHDRILARPDGDRNPPVGLFAPLNRCWRRCTLAVPCGRPWWYCCCCWLSPPTRVPPSSCGRRAPS